MGRRLYCQKGGVFYSDGDTLTRESFSAEHFLNLARFIQGNYGIKVPDSKKLMIESRLRRRMRQVGQGSIDEYLDYAFSQDGRRHELINLVDAVTTNKTDFFREPAHFDILCNDILPRVMSRNTFCNFSTIRVWSAACSTGEEPYTLAMVLNEFAERKGGVKFDILASDLSTRVLKKAHSALYREEQIKDIPVIMRGKYLLKSKDRALELVKINDQLRKMVTFRRINLMVDDFGIREKMHIIFCRNVMIYFTKEDQERLVNKFSKILDDGGFLFLGHSETLAALDIPFVQVMPTVYQKK